MSKAILLTAIPLTLCSASCKLPSAADDPSVVTNLRFSPSAFDSFRRNTEIKYTLRLPATLSIHIVRRDSSGQMLLVNTLVENVYETKGTHAHTWLGDTRTGFFAPTGLYIGVLQIGNQRFETAVRVFHF
jgi:hypothetical protein